MLFLFIFFLQTQCCTAEHDSTCQPNCCPRGAPAKFGATISYTGRQDARNVRGHFSKLRRCRNRGAFDSCLATLRYLLFIYIYIIFATLTLIHRSRPGFAPKRRWNLLSLGCLLSGNDGVLAKRAQKLGAFRKLLLGWVLGPLRAQLCVTICVLAVYFSPSASPGCYLLPASS